jgi:hypothetical protein
MKQYTAFENFRAMEKLKETFPATCFRTNRCDMRHHFAIFRSWKRCSYIDKMETSSILFLRKRPPLQNKGRVANIYSVFGARACSLHFIFQRDDANSSATD